MGYVTSIDRKARISSLWAEVSLIAAFQEMADETDPVGRKARKIRLDQIARELRRMIETPAGDRIEARKRA